MAGLRGSLVPVFRPCALAMSERRIASEADERVEMRDEPLGVAHSGNGTPQLLAGDLGRIRAEDACLGFHHLTERSEERRVGKEWRAGWGAQHSSAVTERALDI